mgnify:CR=1 FL=1
MAEPVVEYRDCPNHPGYRVGSDGSVWSCWTAAGRYKAATMSGVWKQKKATVARNGYCVTRVKGVLHYVHTLVLEAFVGPCPPGMECRHFPDRDPTNNNLTNLSWGTRSRNQRDRNAHGTDNRGSKHGMSKLTEAAIRKIREDAALPISLRPTQGTQARRYGVDQSVISEVINRKLWKHVE